MQIENVIEIIKWADKPFMFVNNEFENTNNNNIDFYRIDHKVIGSRPFIFFGRYVLYQLEQFGKIKILKNSKEVIKEIEPGFNIYHCFIDSNSNQLIIPSRNTRTYWTLNEKLELNDLKYYQQYQIQYRGKLFHFKSQNYTCFEFGNTEPIWSIDLNSFDVVLKTGIFGLPFCFENHFYIPTEDQRLLAFNMTNGELIWDYSPDDISFDYQLENEKIYTFNCKKLTILNCENSELIEIIDLEKAFKEFSFKPLGPLRVFKNVIIFTDHMKGELVVLDLKTNKFSFFSIGMNFPVAKDSVKIVNDKIYIIDLHNVLHEIKTTTQQML